MTDEEIWKCLVYGYNIEVSKTENLLDLLKPPHPGPLGSIAAILGHTIQEEGISIKQTLVDTPWFKKDIIEHIKDQL